MTDRCKFRGCKAKATNSMQSGKWCKLHYWEGHRQSMIKAHRPEIKELRKKEDARLIRNHTARIKYAINKGLKEWGLVCTRS